MEMELLFSEKQGMGFMARLETLIKADGIYVRFLPIHWSFNKYDWSEISTAFVRSYHPIVEYGGWGFRYSFRNGKVWSVTGNWGIQLVFNNGNKLLIGTQKSKEAAQILKELGYFNPNDFV